jgi:DNA polymerase
VLWRLAGEPLLLQAAGDPDSDQARGFAAAVAAAGQKMRAFAGFAPLSDDPATHLAWFEPAHRVTEAVAPFFARRFAGQRFSLLTPDACAHWNGRALSFTPGADPADAPRGDTLEAWWRGRYAGLLEPSCPDVSRNLPVDPSIPAPMAPSPAPSRREMRAAQRASRDAPYDGVAVGRLPEVRAGVMMCRRCDLYRNATQGVVGEGPARARLMLVGEQPGDQEDLAGRPFVGPAGRMLDKALAEAGVPRGEVYVTNAVKHFKHELRGKKRIHKTPATGEVTACRWWLDNERRITRPRVIVALGATAALSVFGKPMPVGENRHQALQLSNQAQGTTRGVVTWHPSFLLRAPDFDARAKAYAEFVEDLKFAWKLAG